MDSKPIQAKDLLKTKGIFKANANDTLASALTHLKRTHDAVFVFDETDKFIGIINPFYSVFKTSFPAETKLSHCIFHPPLISLDTYLWDIAKLMVESKIYFLPVFEKNKFVGIVTLNRMLGAIRELNSKQSLSLNLKKKMTTIDQDASLHEAYTTMRDRQVSRLPVVNKFGRLVGMVTRYDIQKAFTAPQEKPRFLSYVHEKEHFLKRPLSGHYNKIVVSQPLTTSPAQIIEKLVSQNVGSVIIIDGQRKPVGIVSTHDILKAVEGLRPQKASYLDINVSPDFIHESQLTEHINVFMKKIIKSYPVEKIQAVLKTEKNAAGKIKLYEFSMHVHFKNRHQIVFSNSEGHEWQQVVKNVLNKIKSQLFD
jgi:CBS domain-containing protein